MVATVPTSVKEAEVGAVDRERSGPLAAEDTNRTGKKTTNYNELYLQELLSAVKDALLVSSETGAKIRCTIFSTFLNDISAPCSGEDSIAQSMYRV